MCRRRLACECVVLFAGLQTAQLTKRNRSIVAGSPHVSFGSSSTELGYPRDVRFPPIATGLRTSREVRLVPEADIGKLFDQLVGGGD